MSQFKPCESILVEVSAGELLDKISILQIKRERITDREKVANVERELALLEQAAFAALPQLNMEPDLKQLCAELKAVNEELWEIEDDIRECEAQKTFDQHFIALARAVYQTNDHRSDVKKRINRLTGSKLKEEKSYSGYWILIVDRQAVERSTHENANFSVWCEKFSYKRALVCGMKILIWFVNHL